MKYLILTTSIFFLTLSVFGQNGLKNGNLFLLLKDNRTVSINSFENEKVNEIKTFPITEKSIYTTDQKDRVVVLDISKNNLSIFDIYTSKQINLSIPFDIKPKTILLNNDNIFIGGEMGKEILIQYHIKNGKWYQLEIPKEVQNYGKAVDDLIINDSLLIAVDNIAIPKYILYYNLDSKDKLDFSHFKKLKSNSSYESIHQGRITSKYLGLISETMNYGSTHEHITIYSDLNLTKSFAISIEFVGTRAYNDILLIDDKLYVANRDKGLGIFEIKESYFKESQYKFGIINSRVNENLVVYKQYEQGEIIRLTIIPSTNKIILTIRNARGEITNEIVEI